MKTLSRQVIYYYFEKLYYRRTKLFVNRQFIFDNIQGKEIVYKIGIDENLSTWENDERRFRYCVARIEVSALRSSLLQVIIRC